MPRPTPSVPCALAGLALLAALTASACVPRSPEPLPSPIPQPQPDPPPEPQPGGSGPPPIPGSDGSIPVATPASSTGATLSAQPAPLEGPLQPGSMIRGEETLQVMFDTGGVTLVRQVGTCMPVQACTWIVAREQGKEDRRITTVAELSEVVREVRSELEALAFAAFLTQNRASFRDFHCEQGVIRGEVFDGWRVPADVRPDPGAVTTTTQGKDGPFVLTRYLGCYTDSGVDKLVLSKEEVMGDGSYRLDDSNVLYEGRFLPRYR